MHYMVDQTLSLSEEKNNINTKKILFFFLNGDFIYKHK